MAPNPIGGRDHSGVVVPPPALYLVLFLVGVGLQQYAPLPRLPIVIGRVFSVVLAAGAVSLIAWSFRRFWAAGTSVVPVRPSTALVIEGPYRFTRNPIYLGMLLIYLAFACWFGLIWPLVLAPVVIGIVNWYVIGREERYLDGKFGHEYRQYRMRVRRWL